MITYKQLINKYQDLCESNNISRQTAMVYLLEISNKASYDLYVNYDQPVSQDILQEFEKGMEKILLHTPLEHVLGYSWFYGYKFKVNQDVLIPRPETEELVSLILAKCDEYYFAKDLITAVDIGTGSGAIAISLLKEEKKFKMYASDISAEAVEVAKANAKLNDVEIEFKQGNMLDPLIAEKIKVDVLICNPPYIPQDEQLETSVIDFEPHVALFGGSDGLKYYLEVFNNCKKILNPCGMMAFEIGWNQREVLLAKIKEYLPMAHAEVLKDINGKDRMLFVKFND